eukprot:gene4271-8497_t
MFLTDPPPGENDCSAYAVLDFLERITVFIDHNALTKVAHKLVGFSLYVFEDLIVDFINQQICAIEGQMWLKQRVRNITQIILLIYREAINVQLGIDAFGPSLRSINDTSWTSVAIKTLKLAWKERAANAVKSKSRNQALHIGKLVDLDWKLALTTHSQDSDMVARLYATIALKYMTPSGTTHNIYFDASPNQIQEIMRSLRDMQTIMESA